MKFSAMTLLLFAALNFLKITIASPPERPMKPKIDREAERISSQSTLYLSSEFRQKYSIIREIGRGDYGVVYSALRLADYKDVAIKFGRPSKVNNMMKEAAILTYAQLNWVPNMLTMLDEGTAGIGLYYIVTPLIEYRKGYKTTLLDYIRNSPPSQFGSLGIIKKLATTLDALHQIGIVHNDIKLTNVLINEENEPILIDFGCANTDVMQKYFCGTYLFLSPLAIEVANRKATQFDGTKNDVYALGILYFYLLSWKRPPTPEKLYAQILFQPWKTKYGEKIDLKTHCLFSGMLRSNEVERFSMSDVLRVITFMEKGGNDIPKIYLMCLKLTPGRPEPF